MATIKDTYKKIKNLSIKIEGTEVNPQGYSNFKRDSKPVFTNEKTTANYDTGGEDIYAGYNEHDISFETYMLATTNSDYKDLQSVVIVDGVDTITGEFKIDTSVSGKPDGLGKQDISFTLKSSGVVTVVKNA